MWRDLVWQSARRGRARRGMAGHGSPGHDSPRSGMIRRDEDRLATVRLAMAWLGVVGSGASRQGVARFVTVRCGAASRGKTWHGSPSSGEDGHGSAWWIKYLAAFLLVLVAVIGLNAARVWATDVNVTQTARCVNADTGRYDVVVGADNTYDKPLHVRVNNPASPIDLTLAPGQTWSYTFHVTGGPWTVTFTSTDAHLKGDVTRTWTLEQVCGLPATTTSSPPTTTCLQANPPRSDCQPPPPTVASTTVTPPGTSVEAPPDQPLPGKSVSSPPATAAPRLPSSVARPSTLAVTGTGSTLAAFAIGAGAALAGMALVLFAMRRRSS